MAVPPGVPSQGGNVQLEQFSAGDQISGLRRGTVTVLHVERHDADAGTVTFRTDDGELASEIPYAADTARLRPQRAVSHWTFDADPVRYRLVAEAMRTASLFRLFADPVGITA